jgi:hypothetical protein
MAGFYSITSASYVSTVTRSPLHEHLSRLEESRRWPSLICSVLVHLTRLPFAAHFMWTGTLFIVQVTDSLGLLCTNWTAISLSLTLAIRRLQKTSLEIFCSAAVRTIFRVGSGTRRQSQRYPWERQVCTRWSHSPPVRLLLGSLIQNGQFVGQYFSRCCAYSSVRSVTNGRKNGHFGTGRRSYSER